MEHLESVRIGPSYGPGSTKEGYPKAFPHYAKDIDELSQSLKRVSIDDQPTKDYVTAVEKFPEALKATGQRGIGGRTDAEIRELYKEGERLREEMLEPAQDSWARAIEDRSRSVRIKSEIRALTEAIKQKTIENHWRFLGHGGVSTPRRVAIFVADSGALAVVW